MNRFQDGAVAGVTAAAPVAPKAEPKAQPEPKAKAGQEGLAISALV